MTIPEKYRKDEVIIRETAEQVIKDFARAGIGIEFSGNTLGAYDELVFQISQALKSLANSRSEKLLSLLYIIDIPEDVFNDLVNAKGNEEYETEFAGRIVRREFEKVITRRYFSGKQE
ncbi:MAG: hypothetical protein DWQ44_04415 [Bacteroidetes bacterium]|nr:MAG: hypothetical protein DWQ33_11375 [Bacteroidota bacterium]REK00683.1 MAG: hypothetical protein DWQ39_11050 [Bacteroidota bacterium]REK35195.1 MAG: hypothetical protein DWQ44_04415 [Bacteroidota bacterium]REK48272.1 MAG: hypothetical protein DWQ48_10615 [Bacteroidota bacterium]